jgi:protein required for attachment to host cells
MILPHGTIVAVADGAALKFFRNQGVEPEINLVAFAHPAVVPINPGSGSRHRSDSSNPDRHRKAEDGFAAASASQLNHLALDGTLERVLVIADPRTLGELRKHFHPTLQAKIIGELSRDLSDHSVHDIVMAIRHAS